MDYLVRIFKSVANETRVKLLESLVDHGEQALEQLSWGLKLPYKTVSRNLKTLEKAMLVKSRLWRRKVYYSLETSPKLVYGRAILGMIKKRTAKKKRE